MYYNDKLIALLFYIQNQKLSVKKGLQLIAAFIKREAPELTIKPVFCDIAGEIEYFDIVFGDNYSQASIVCGYSSFYFEA